MKTPGNHGWRIQNRDEMKVDKRQGLQEPAGAAAGAAAQARAIESHTGTIVLQ